MILRPEKFEEKWHIVAETDEFGEVFLLDSSCELPLPATFSTKEEALSHIKKANKDKNKSPLIEDLNEYFGYEAANMDEFINDFYEEGLRDSSLMNFLRWYDNKLTN